MLPACFSASVRSHYYLFFVSLGGQVTLINNFYLRFHKSSFSHFGSPVNTCTWQSNVLQISSFMWRRSL